MSDRTGLKKPMPTRLWLLLALIVISVIMGVVSIFYWVWGLLYHYVPDLPTLSFPLSFLLTTMYTLEIPLFVLAVSLLFIYMTIAKKGMATWSRLLFFAGALFLMAGALFDTAYYWWLYLHDWANSDTLYTLSFIEQIIYALGIVVCIISALLLIWCYMKGEIHAKPKESSSR